MFCNILALLFILKLYKHSKFYAQKFFKNLSVISPQTIFKFLFCIAIITLLLQHRQLTVFVSFLKLLYLSLALIAFFLLRKIIL